MTEARTLPFPGGTFFWLVLKLPMCDRPVVVTVVAISKERPGEPERRQG